MPTIDLRKTVTAKELVEATDAIGDEHLPIWNRGFKAKGPWGNWEFDRARLVLVHKLSGYEIDLETMESSAEVLDWIFQVYQKTWMSTLDVAWLLRALDELLNPQANYCSFGSERMTKPKYKALMSELRK